MQKKTKTKTKHVSKKYTRSGYRPYGSEYGGHGDGSELHVVNLTEVQQVISQRQRLLNHSRFFLKTDAG